MARTHRVRPDRAAPVVAAALAASIIVSLSGCADFARQRELDMTAEQWARALGERGVDPSSIVNPLRHTPEMAQAALEATGRARPLERLRRLQDYLFDASRFPFDYSSRETYTAQEAFSRRRGNCVSFTMLFISMARSVGLPVRAAMLSTRGDVEKEGELVIVNSHIVAVYEDGVDTTVFDFYTTQERSALGVRAISDVRITAIYLVNLGAHELIAGQLDQAGALLETAVTLAPDFAVAHGNLGVVRRRQGDLDGAFAAYRRAIEIDPGESTVLHNLAGLYRSVGRSDEARAALAAVEGGGRNPYLLLMRGDFELNDGNPGRALRLYRRAMRRGPTLADPRVAIARARIAMGDGRAARAALLKALELEPGHAAATRLLASLAPGDEP